MPERHVATMRSPNYSVPNFALQNSLSSAALPDEVPADVAQRLNALIEILDRHQVSECARHDGLRRGHAWARTSFRASYIIDELHSDRIVGRVTFGRYFLGANGAAHAGVHALLLSGDPHQHRASLYGAAGPRRGRKRWGRMELVDPAGAVLAD